LRERSPGVWELRVRTGRDPVTGAYGQVSRTFRGPKRQAEAALARLSAEVADGRHSGTGQTVGFLLDQWISQLEAQGRAPKTLDGYRSLIKARLRPGLGHIPLRKLGPADLDAFYRRLLAEGLSPLTIRHAHAALSTALRQAVKWGWIDRSPAERASPPSVPHSEVKPPTPEEVDRLMDELERTAPDLTAMVWVAVTTGCRRAELCGLRWSDLELERPSIIVRRSITDTKSVGVAEKDTKNHRSRRLALDWPTVAVLYAQKERMKTRAAEAGVALVEDPYVWSQDPTCGSPYKPDRVTDSFRNARKRIGLDHVDFHHLRHFSATTLAGAGIDVRTIAGRLGHANPAITLRTYAHFLDVTDRKAAEIMGNLHLRTTPRVDVDAS